MSLLLETSKQIMMTEKERELTQDMLDLIDRIKNKTDYINTDDRIPELELEVILSKIEQLYQKAIGLKYLRQFADGISASLTEKEKMIQEVTPPVLHEVEIQENIIEEIVASEPTEEKTIEIETIEQDISALGNSSNEGIIEKLQQQAISDIKNAIGINDKFLFTNELFAGNSQEFEITINQLNQLSSMEEAKEKLEKYSWSEENEAAQSFLTLVARRYL